MLPYNLEKEQKIRVKRGGEVRKILINCLTVVQFSGWTVFFYKSKVDFFFIGGGGHFETKLPNHFYELAFLKIERGAL